MELIESVTGAGVLAECDGIPEEIEAEIVRVAEAELAAGRLAAARTILEGLVVTRCEHATAWALLSQAHRRLGEPLAARFCAEVAAKLAPGDRFVRLARAESVLATEEERSAARAELDSLAAGTDTVAERARALLAALGA